MWSFLLVIAFRGWGVPTLVGQTASTAQEKVILYGYRIAGTVVSKTDGHPLDRARVFLQSAEDSRSVRSVVTGEEGRFEFSGLTPGKYSLRGSRHGFISAAYDQHEQFSTSIVAGADLDTGNLTLKLAPTAIINGRVFDEVGDPVREATVILYRDDPTGYLSQIQKLRDTRTDDQGAYEIAQIEPGTYFVSANAKPWYAVHSVTESTAQGMPVITVDESLDVAYPTTYYADATDPDSAAPILVRPGDDIKVDVHLNPVPALHVLFHVPGDAVHGFSFPQLFQPAFGGFNLIRDAGGHMISPGIVEVNGIPAGRYNVHIDTGGQDQGIQISGVDISKTGEEFDTSRGEMMSRIKVAMQVGKPAMPEHLFVGLRSEHRQIKAFQALDGNGQAELERVVPGKYEVVVWSAVKTYSISHIFAEGKPVFDHIVSVAPGASLSISLGLVNQDAEVRGTAKRTGKGFAGATIVLIPNPPPASRDFLRRNQSDLDGTFDFRGVDPGSYTILAIANGWDLDWSLPGVMRPYLERGKTINVSSGQVLNLAYPIEVQGK